MNPRGESREAAERGREREPVNLPPRPLRPKAAFVIVSIERLRGRLRNAKHAPPLGEYQLGELGHAN